MTKQAPTITQPFLEPARTSRYKTIGDTGLMNYGGYVNDHDVTKLLGPMKWRVLRQMALSPDVGALLFAIEMLIRRSEWTVVPVDDSAAAVEIAEAVEQMRNDMATSWEDVLAELLDFLTYGFSLHEIIYKRRDDGLIGWADWSPRPPDTIARWEFDETGNVTAVVQRTATMREVVIPIAKCLHITNDSAKRSPEGESALLPAYPAWKAIRHIEYIEGVGIERELNGYPYLKVPGDVMSDANRSAELQAAYDLVRGIRFNEDGGAVLPSERWGDDGKGQPMYELGLLSTSGTRAIDTSTVIQRYTGKLVETTLAGFLTVGHNSTGTYSLATEKTRMFNLALQSWLDAIAEAITKQAIRPLVALNGWDVDLAPSIYAGAPDNADLARDGEYFKALLPLVTKLAPEDQERLYDALAALADWPEREAPFTEPEPMMPPAGDGGGLPPADPDEDAANSGETEEDGTA